VAGICNSVGGGVFLNTPLQSDDADTKVGYSSSNSAITKIKQGYWQCSPSWLNHNVADIYKDNNESQINLPKALIDALFYKHKNNDGNDRNQQLHQVCVNDIPTNVICKEKKLQCRTTWCSLYSKYCLQL